MANTLLPEWQQTVVFMNCNKRTLKRRVLEVTVWDYDRLKTNDFMGQTLISLGGELSLGGRSFHHQVHYGCGKKTLTHPRILFQRRTFWMAGPIGTDYTS